MELFHINPYLESATISRQVVDIFRNKKLHISISPFADTNRNRFL